MANTTFSGPVTSTNGFVGAVTGNVTGAVAATTITASSTLGVTGDADLLGTANVIIIPTSDPGVTGAIWNNAGTLAVSA
jgi:hypothetical protein